MAQVTIAFIGAGNMARSIIGGLLKSGHAAESLRASDPFPASLETLREMGLNHVFTDNAEAAQGADVVVLAVKPQVMAEAAVSVAEEVTQAKAVVVSIAAGITLESLQQRLGADTAGVRCMPNTPALLSCGASALFANAHASEAQRQHAQSLLEAVGLCRWVDSESALDAITALSGSGPAYFFLMMEAMQDAGVALGLDEVTARDMALQTALGAARMATESDVDVVELRRRVTSPAGTTEAAIKSFEAEGLHELVSRAMRAAYDRSEEMARELG